MGVKFYEANTLGADALVHVRSCYIKYQEARCQ